MNPATPRSPLRPSPEAARLPALPPSSRPPRRSRAIEENGENAGGGSRLARQRRSLSGVDFVDDRRRSVGKFLSLQQLADPGDRAAVFSGNGRRRARSEVDDQMEDAAAAGRSLPVDRVLMAGDQLLTGETVAAADRFSNVLPAEVANCR